jgi:hypothetical protein
MPDLTRRPDPHRADSWRVYYGDVRVGTIARAVGTPNATEEWRWQCGFYPGCNAGEHRAGAAATFDQARAGFERAWLVFSARRTEADYQAWRDHQAWTKEKYRRLDRGERMPPDWRPYG